MCWKYRGISIWKKVQTKGLKEKQNSRFWSPFHFFQPPNLDLWLPANGKATGSQREKESVTGILNITQGSLMWSVRWILPLVRPQVLLRDLSTHKATFTKRPPQSSWLQVLHTSLLSPPHHCVGVSCWYLSYIHICTHTLCDSFLKREIIFRIPKINIHLVKIDLKL